MGIDTYKYISNVYNYMYDVCLSIQLYKCLNDNVQ